jgi:hypothetical protein
MALGNVTGYFNEASAEVATDDTLSTGAIAGIVIAVLVVVAGISGFVFVKLCTASKAGDSLSQSITTNPIH